jgi:hypothetical protein
MGFERPVDGDRRQHIDRFRNEVTRDRKWDDDYRAARPDRFRYPL